MNVFGVAVFLSHAGTMGVEGRQSWQRNLFHQGLNVPSTNVNIFRQYFSCKYVNFMLDNYKQQHPEDILTTPDDHRYQDHLHHIGKHRKQKEETSTQIVWVWANKQAGEKCRYTLNIAVICQQLWCLKKKFINNDVNGNTVIAAA